MKFFLKKYYLTAVAALLCLTSCLDNDGRTVYSREYFGVIEHDALGWYFMNYDSTTFSPVNKVILEQENARCVIASMEFDSDIKPRKGYDYTVKINKLLYIPTLSITATDPTGIDAAPNDSLLAVTGTVSLQYLTLEVVYNTIEGKEHTFKLLRDSLNTEEPIQLLLSHDNGGNSPEKTFGTYLSFDLETLAERHTQDSVRLRFIPPSKSRLGDTLSFTYRFIR